MGDESHLQVAMAMFGLGVPAFLTGAEFLAWGGPALRAAGVAALGAALLLHAAAVTLAGRRTVHPLPPG